MDIILKKYEYDLLLEATATLIEYSQMFSEVVPDDYTKEDMAAAMTAFCASTVEIEDSLTEGRFEELNEVIQDTMLNLDLV